MKGNPSLYPVFTLSFDTGGVRCISGRFQCSQSEICFLGLSAWDNSHGYCWRRIAGGAGLHGKFSLETEKDTSHAPEETSERTIFKSICGSLCWDFWQVSNTFEPWAPPDVLMNSWVTHCKSLELLSGRNLSCKNWHRSMALHNSWALLPNNDF